MRNWIIRRLRGGRVGLEVRWRTSIRISLPLLLLDSFGEMTCPVLDHEAYEMRLETVVCIVADSR